jgi:glycerate-2-kinase
LEGNGARIPWITTSQDYRRSISEAINKALRDSEPEDQALINAIQSIQIANNEILVRFGKAEAKGAGE